MINLTVLLCSALCVCIPAICLAFVPCMLVVWGGASGFVPYASRHNLPTVDKSVVCRMKLYRSAYYDNTLRCSSLFGHALPLSAVVDDTLLLQRRIDVFP